MVRDTLAVPATGAGVEREFTCSGQVIVIIAMEATRASKACDADEELVLSEWRKGWWGKRRSQLRL